MRAILKAVAGSDVSERSVIISYHPFLLVNCDPNPGSHITQVPIISVHHLSMGVIISALYYYLVHRQKNY